MDDDDVDDLFSSRRFTMPGSFPFVFLPSAFANGFPFTTEETRPSTNNVQSVATEIPENDEQNEKKKHEETESNDENDHGISEKNDLRISQPKYSQLLKELDFSHARMVDVTELLSDKIDAIEETNEHEKATEDEVKNRRSSSGLESMSSIESREQESKKTNDNQTRENDTTEEKRFTIAANEIQNDLNNLAAMIDQISVDDEESQKVEESYGDGNPDVRFLKKSTFDEDDDTSKQATQNYDLNDFEREDLLPSSKSSRIPRLISQRSDGHQKANQSMPVVDSTADNVASNISWNDLVHGAEPIVEAKVTQLIEVNPLTPRKISKEVNHSSPNRKTQEQVDFSMQQRSKDSRHRQSSTSSSSNTESVVEHQLYPMDPEQLLTTKFSPRDPLESSHNRTPSNFPPPPPFRQDSQGTLLDENLDDLSSQIKQVFFDQERQTFNTSTKEERTVDGIGSMSFPISTSDRLEADRTNPIHEMVFRRIPNPSEDQYHRKTAETTQNEGSPKKRNHHRHHHHHHHHRHQQQHRHNSSRHVMENDESNLRQNDDNWLGMLEKLEREHRERLDHQRKQYEHQMQTLEVKMQRRFDEYLTLTSGVQESRLEDYEVSPRRYKAIPIDSNVGRYKRHSSHSGERPAVREIIDQYYPADSTLNILSSGRKRSGGISFVVQPDMRDPVKHHTAEPAEHIATLKIHYEQKIDELKDQIKRIRMGQTSSATRQSIETIERINNENINLHDEVTDLRHALQLMQDENKLLKQEIDDLQQQMTNRDVELKSYHRTIAELEKKLTEAENTRKRQEETMHRTDRKVSFYREENEKMKNELNLNRDRLLRLEERFHDQEIENQTLRRQIFLLEKDNSRSRNRHGDELKLNSTAITNVPTSRDYGRFALSTSKETPINLNRSRETNFDFDRIPKNVNETKFVRQTHSPRSMTRITEYLNEKPVFPRPYVAPQRTTFSPKKSSTDQRRRRYDTGSSRVSSNERPIKHSDQLEQKFDQLFKKKQELEARLNRIPTRNLTSTDRQLCDVLEREIDRVDQQIASVKLELRKLNVLRSH